MVPTVLVEGPYRYFFYSADRTEPAHVHIEREAHRAKFWLSPVRLARSGGVGLCGPVAAQGYPDKPITLIVPFAAGGPSDTIGRLVAEREALFLRAWDEHFTASE